MFKDFRKNKEKEVALLLRKVNCDEDTDIDSLGFNWCIFRNDILYFGNYDHPGGNRFFEAVKGREVSRFIYGI